MNKEQKYKYNQNDRVYFNMGNGISGWAKVVGCSTDEMATIGRGWILELEEESRTISKDVYPFTNIVAFDVMLSDGPKKE
jgi:lipopolysaccharide/colanic/teichoic acid biosynthesis glycosyltransferase